MLAELGGWNLERIYFRRLSLDGFNKERLPIFRSVGIAEVAYLAPARERVYLFSLSAQSASSRNSPTMGRNIRPDRRQARIEFVRVASGKNKFAISSQKQQP